MEFWILSMSYNLLVRLSSEVDVLRLNFQSYFRFDFFYSYFSLLSWNSFIISFNCLFMFSLSFLRHLFKLRLKSLNIFTITILCSYLLLVLNWIFLGPLQKGCWLMEEGYSTGSSFCVFVLGYRHLALLCLRCFLV